MKYEIQIPEVHYSIWQVDAKTEAEAIELALEGEADEITLEYSHTDTDSNNFRVREMKK